VEIGAQELRDEVAAKGQRASPTRCPAATYISSRGEMKMSLSEITWTKRVNCCRGSSTAVSGDQRSRASGA
jgi:hypothetical protein